MRGVRDRVFSHPAHMSASPHVGPTTKQGKYQLCEKFCDLF